MDIVTIIVSAVAGILVWNMFFSKKSTNHVCESESKIQITSPPDIWQVKSALISTFGTTNINAALELSKKFPDPEPDIWQVKSALLETFGTTDLSAMVQYFSKGSDKDPYTNLAPFDSYRVAHHLQETFGTTDLSAMIQYFSNIENKNKETAE